MTRLASKDYGYYHSPIGWIEIIADKQIIALTFVATPLRQHNNGSNVVITRCIGQLKNYFEQKLRNFNLPLAIKGTAFQELVWKATYQIPYGTTLTYQELAQKINQPKAIRAVGSALAKNPFAIIVPCHRVIRANNQKIINYHWGQERKIFLQKLEQTT